MNDSISNENNKSGKIVLVLVLLSSVTFICLHGPYILNPFYTDWLMTGDRCVGFLGARAYANSRWMFPIGLLDTLHYPGVSSIIFTDSIPLLALLYKLFASIFSNLSIQYVGIWLLICYILQGTIGGLVIYKHTRSIVVICIGAFFFLMSPVLLYRFPDHPTLMGQWTVLLSMIPFVYEEYFDKDIRRTILLFSFVAFFTAGIHMYLVLECGIMAACYCIYKAGSTKKIGTYISVLGIFAATAIIWIYLYGGLSNKSLYAGDGYGYHSGNLNSFINSMNTSLFIPRLPNGQGQYEGFAYLGAGVLLLLIIDFCVIVHKKSWVEWEINKPLVISVIFFCIVCIILSLSNVIMLNSRVIASYPLPRSLEWFLSIFRSSGRLIWPVYYFIILMSLIILVKQCRKETTYKTILFLCVSLQIVDIYPLYSGARINNTIQYKSLIDEETLSKVIKTCDIEHLVLVDDFSYDLQYSLCKVALDNKVTMNYFRMAHGNLEYKEYAKDAVDSAKPGYLFLYNSLANEERSSLLEYYAYDEYIVGVSKEGKQPEFLRVKE